MFLHTWTYFLFMAEQGLTQWNKMLYILDHLQLPLHIYSHWRRPCLTIDRKWAEVLWSLDSVVFKLEVTELFYQHVLMNCQSNFKTIWKTRQIFCLVTTVNCSKYLVTRSNVKCSSDKWDCCKQHNMPYYKQKFYTVLLLWIVFGVTESK